MDSGTRLIPVADVELAVLEAGPVDGRPLLLVHGFTAVKEDFADHLEAFGRLGWRAVAPDLRGHGRSSKPTEAGAYSLRAFSADLLALADAIGWERFTLLGHSMGGMVAQCLAIDAPDRLDALVLMDTSHGALGEQIPPELVELARQVVTDGGMSAFLEVSKTVDDPLSSPAYARLLVERPGHEAYGDAKVLAASPHMWLGMIDELVSPSADRLSALAASVRVPTLVVVGEQDTAFRAHADRLAAAIPGAHLVVLPDAGHAPQFESPTAWFAAVSDFLARVPTSAQREIVR
jgi:pimeloyl-ACP methyl ester carboxylesterase